MPTFYFWMVVIFSFVRFCGGINSTAVDITNGVGIYNTVEHTAQIFY